MSLDGGRDDISRLQAEGKTVIVVGDGRAAWGLIAIRDNIRPNARKAIEELHAVGVEKVVMLTGDRGRGDGRGRDGRGAGNGRRRADGRRPGEIGLRAPASPAQPVVGAVAGFFSLPIAVLGHEISEFVVIGSGLRMLRT